MAAEAEPGMLETEAQRVKINEGEFLKDLAEKPREMSSTTVTAKAQRCEAPLTAALIHRLFFLIEISFCSTLNHFLSFTLADFLRFCSNCLRKDLEQPLVFLHRNSSSKQL